MNSTMHIIKNVVLCVCLCTSFSFSTEYYVDKNHPKAGDSNPGTVNLPWLTVRNAANNVTQAGDIVYVREGTYDEYVTLTHSGSAAGGFITFVGFAGDTKPVVRGFDVSGCSYVRIIGFEITHINSSYGAGVRLSSRSSYIEILDNYFHHTYGAGGGVHAGLRSPTHITVRGNEFYYCGYVPGVDSSGNASVADTYANSSHWLVEYNIAHRMGDFVNLGGDYHIVRNNNFYDYSESYFPGSSHIDFFQPGSDGVDLSVHHHIYESNFLWANLDDHSHTWQMRDNANNAEAHIIIRGNVNFDQGSYVMQCGGMDTTYLYNNTFYNINKFNPNSVAIAYRSEGGNATVGNFNYNNIFSQTGSGAIIAGDSNPNEVTSSSNIAHNSGYHYSVVSVVDPLFAAANTQMFYLQQGSPAINAGRPITSVVSPDGVGSSFSVGDAKGLCDGWEIVAGDFIKVGNNDPVRITGITGNTIAVDREILWEHGDGVFWRNQDTEPDIGAYEYRPTDYDYDIRITRPYDRPTSDRLIDGSVDIITETTNPECIRFVIFYVNGIPVFKDFEAPYSFKWNCVGMSEGRYIIEARAYALYADRNLTKSDKIDFVLGNYINPPRNLRIQN